MIGKRMAIHFKSKRRECMEKSLWIADACERMHCFTGKRRKRALLTRDNGARRTQLRSHEHLAARICCRFTAAISYDRINCPESSYGFAKRAGREQKSISKSTRVIHYSDFDIAGETIVLQSI